MISQGGGGVCQSGYGEMDLMILIEQLWKILRAVWKNCPLRRTLGYSHSPLGCTLLDTVSILRTHLREQFSPHCHSDLSVTFTLQRGGPGERILLAFTLHILNKSITKAGQWVGQVRLLCTIVIVQSALVCGLCQWTLQSRIRSGKLKICSNTPTTDCIGSVMF